MLETVLMRSTWKARRTALYSHRVAVKMARLNRRFLQLQEEEVGIQKNGPEKFGILKI